MDRILMLLVTMAVAFAGGLAWDRRPAIDWRLPIPILRPHVRFPGGAIPEARAALALAVGERDRARSNVGVMSAALKDQNAAVSALGDDTRRRAEALVRGLERTAGAVAKAQTRAEALDFVPEGDDVCAKFMDVDRHVREAMRE